MLTKIKTITSHAGHARFLAECDGEFAGYIPRQTDIPSPYAYSPTHAVWMWDTKPVIIVETKHRRFTVFAVPADMIMADETDAMNKYLETKK